jgi:phosphinothricin acetyltransferase
MEIRLATPADAVAIRAIYAPIVSSTPISFELEPPTVEEMAARITAVLPTYPWLVLTDGGGVAGYAYAHAYQPRPAYRWSVETSVYMGDGRRGAGLGGSLYRSLLDVLARQGYRQAVAGVALPNPASVGLHRACGFRLTGVQERLGWKLGAWHDVGWFQRELVPGSGAPAAPIAVDRLAPATLAAALQLGAQHVDRRPQDHPQPHANRRAPQVPGERSFGGGAGRAR